MNIGIVVYSQTGNTYEVAQKVKEALSKKGNSVNIERIHISDEKERDIKKLEAQFKDDFLNNTPDLSKYEALVFGSPVHAFSLSPAMTAFISQIPSLQNKKISCFVTKGLPLSGTGGNQAISKMKQLSESKGGNFCGSGIVVWNKDREKQIKKLTEEMCKAFF
ncbi:MAG: flavodoxin [Candidatus Methanofastidiosum methylothiophilum]|uniref:Flavodoxin n=1 Tax=Candidatus Methanofastidiosum methylothiophilum TaxID=1705564 RepID=A0A150IQV2_9EURY|nr:MAG: flavodoxin [Candidatus Methanofastidiosum methylthiophilus]KYC47034.1 MAG: flavodoxin [Candidatus Methanofastidiosum methylthiophilus]KYC49461.1 MAG: flavodoxin [Candidatus Methanofastidiosum methylthiophilus]